MIDKGELRARAEGAIPAKTTDAQEDAETLSPEKMRAVLHELRVHQIELEMQNDELRHAYAELDASRSRYFDLYDLAPVGYCTLSEKGLILQVNLRASTLLGMSRVELVGRPIFRSILKEDQVILHKHLQQLFETDAPQFFELRVARKTDGLVFWVRMDAAAAQDEDGIPMCRVTMTDITERKRSDERIGSLLAEKELFLREVHHRIKNNMSTLIGLFTMQAGAMKSPEAASAFEDAKIRVRSMAVIYERLYQSASFESISLLDYLPSLVDDIVANFANSPSVRIETKIDDVVVDVKKAQALGIIINELITNIMKYAFADNSAGRIRVSAFSEGDSIAVIVEDNGVGLPECVDFENSDGFGLVLVRELTRQLEGSVKIERENGTRIIMQFKN
jgi:PAS domain S-box-containing protein